MISSATQRRTSRVPTTQKSSRQDRSGSGLTPELPLVEVPFELTGTQAEALAECIQQRIESRLPCRIRKLQVFVTEGEVVLEGQCSTYYTKQIAQHTAMGVLEYEQLVNRIVVCAAK